MGNTKGEGARLSLDSALVGLGMDPQPASASLRLRIFNFTPPTLSNSSLQLLESSPPLMRRLDSVETRGAGSQLPDLDEEHEGSVASNLVKQQRSGGSLSSRAQTLRRSFGMK